MPITGPRREARSRRGGPRATRPRRRRRRPRRGSAAAHLRGDREPEALEDRRGEVGREHVAVQSGCCRRSGCRRSPRPAMPIASWSCSAGRRALERDQQVVAAEAARRARAARASSALDDARPRPAGAARQARAAAAATRRAGRPPDRRRAQPRIGADRASPASPSVDREQARDDVGRGLVGALDDLAPAGDRGCRAGIERRAAPVVERVEDPVALADVEVGLVGGDVAEPGAQQARGDPRRPPELGERRCRRAAARASPAARPSAPARPGEARRPPRAGSATQRYSR